MHHLHPCLCLLSSLPLPLLTGRTPLPTCCAWATTGVAMTEAAAAPISQADMTGAAPSDHRGGSSHAPPPVVAPGHVAHGSHATGQHTSLSQMRSWSSACRMARAQSVARLTTSGVSAATCDLVSPPLPLVSTGTSPRKGTAPGQDSAGRCPATPGPHSCFGRSCDNYSSTSSRDIHPCCQELLSAWRVLTASIIS
jgi:hypothetical protein